MAKEKKPARLIVEIRSRDGYLVAELMLSGKSHELCRMIRPTKDASLRGEMLDAFNTLAGKIVESIVRDEDPDTDFEVRHFNMPEAGHG